MVDDITALVQYVRSLMILDDYRVSQKKCTYRPKSLFTNHHFTIDMTWGHLILLSLSKKRPKNQSPDTRGAGRWWLSQCTVAPAAFWKCVFWDTLYIWWDRTVPRTTAVVFQTWPRSGKGGRKMPWRREGETIQTPPNFVRLHLIGVGGVTVEK